MKVKVIKMANTSKRYEPEFKKEMVRLVLEEGRTIASVNKEYNLGEGTVRSWIRQLETDQELNESTLDYVYGYYNHIRPHSSNGYMTPFEKRYSNQ